MDPAVIPLSRGLVSSISPEDFEWASQWKWSAANRMPYALRKDYQTKTRKTILLHREILARKIGRQLLSSEYADHKDRNPLNNTRANLRVCTIRDNTCNRRPQKHSSVYTGVFWDKRRGKWQAVICRNYSNISLGVFDAEEDAGRAYDSAAMALHGEFARLNFPGETPAPYIHGKARKRPGLTSRFRGVSWSTLHRKWEAGIRLPSPTGGRGKKTRLGLFLDEEEAAHAYDQKALALRGERARLNFPEKRSCDVL